MKILSKNFRNRSPQRFTLLDKTESSHELFFVRQENLAEELIEALTLAGEEFDADFIRNFPPENVATQKAKESKKANAIIFISTKKN